MDRHPEADAGPRMVGGSGLFRQILGKLRLAAASNAPVLLEGATGTGKELAAGYIHRHSDRARGPFVTLDCTTLGEDLFESEVFGHERGAFTGSVGKRQGLFERAHGGTLFLDEIGEMPLPLQAKLLRVLESGEFRRVGSDVTRKADVRIVCASNRDLRDTNGFRQDLYFRIACVRVRMPSLAERVEDIPVLARELLLRIGATAQRSYRLGSDALALLRSHPFPGNIRELRNVLWVAAVHSDNGRISAEQIALALQVEPVVNGSGQAQAIDCPGPGPATNGGTRDPQGPGGPPPARPPGRPRRQQAGRGRGAPDQRADPLPQAQALWVVVTAHLSEAPPRPCESSPCSGCQPNRASSPAHRPSRRRPVPACPGPGRDLGRDHHRGPDQNRSRGPGRGPAPQGVGGPGPGGQPGGR